MCNFPFIVAQISFDDTQMINNYIDVLNEGDFYKDHFP